MPNHYTYRVFWSAEDNEYVAVCAEFPSLSYLSTKPDAALKGIMKLVDEVLDDMRTNNEEIPEPLTERNYSGKLMLRIPPSLHKELAIEAAEQGVSLNRLISSRL